MGEGAAKMGGIPGAPGLRNSWEFLRNSWEFTGWGCGKMGKGAAKMGGIPGNSGKRCAKIVEIRGGRVAVTN